MNEQVKEDEERRKVEKPQCDAEWVARFAPENYPWGGSLRADKVRRDLRAREPAWGGIGGGAKLCTPEAESRCAVPLRAVARAAFLGEGWCCCCS